MSSNCSHCDEPLSAGQLYARNGTLKACPSCSQYAGQHVFHPFPEAFGTSGKRVSARNPSGAQSQCASCRSGRRPRRGTPCVAVRAGKRQVALFG